MIVQTCSIYTRFHPMSSPSRRYRPWKATQCRVSVKGDSRTCVESDPVPGLLWQQRRRLQQSRFLARFVGTDVAVAIATRTWQAVAVALGRSHAGVYVNSPLR